MKSAAELLAIQSYCLRGFKSNQEVVEKVKECGLKKIELCGVHVDFMNEESFAGVIETYQSGGVDIVSIGVQSFNNQPENEEKYFQFAQQAGCKVIAANFAPESVPDCYRTAEQLADKYDVKLAIHNHGGKHWLGSTQMLNVVFSQTSSRIGLMLDTAWALDAGEDPHQMVETFKERLYGLHLKDFIFDKQRNPEDVVIGQGSIDVEDLFTKLADADDDFAERLRAEVHDPFHFDCAGVDVQAFEIFAFENFVAVVELVLHACCESDHGEVVRVIDVVDVASESERERCERDAL